MDYTSPDANKALQWRGQLFENKRSVVLIGRLNSDILELDKCLLSHIDLKITLFPNKASFLLMSPEANANYGIKINSAKLFIKKFEINPNLALANEKILKSITAKYHFLRRSIAWHLIPAGTSSWSKDNVTFNSQTPKMILISLYDDAQRNGDYRRSPWNAQLHNLATLKVSRDGKDLDLSPISITGNNSPTGYWSLFLSSAPGLYSNDGCVPFDYPS